MNYFSIIYLGIFSLIISVFSFFNIIYSYYFNLYLNLNSYFYSLIVSLFIGFIFIFKSKKNFKTSIYYKILTVVLGYFVLTFLISIPYYFSIYNLTFLDSYFESISGFTSTGFTIFDNIKHLDQSLILWRSSSQWIGGLYFLSSIILLIDIFDTSFKKTLTNFLSFDTIETLKQSFKILILYTSLTFFIFLILKLIDLRTFDAFNLSMTLISSGGFMPVNNLSNIINTNLKEIVFSLLMLSSFFSIFFVYNLFLFKKKNIIFFQEDIYLFIYLLFLLLLFFLLLNYGYNFSVILLSLTSSISNIGISLNKSPQNLSFVFLILVIIGGSFFSTSSGIRFLKLYALFKFSINNLILHARPKNIFLNKYPLFNVNIEDVEINKYFLSVIVFIISLFLLSSLLTISDISLETSFKLSILTIMNTANSYMYGLSDFNFQDLQFFTKIYIIIFMIIGRIELLTLLIIIKKFLFRS